MVKLSGKKGLHVFPVSPVNVRRERAYLHDLASLQLFIYLFAPVLERLRCSDFASLKLESGLRMWAPLLLHRQPYEGSFPVPARTYTHHNQSHGAGDEIRVNPLRSYSDQFGPLPAVFQQHAEAAGENTSETELTTSKTMPYSLATFYPTSPNLNIPNAESSDEVSWLLDSPWRLL